MRSLIITILHILQKKFNSLSYPNIINDIKYMQFTKSYDISQLKNVNHHGHHGLNQHNMIGH